MTEGVTTIGESIFSAKMKLNLVRLLGLDIIKQTLTLFRMGFFGTAHGLGGGEGGKKTPLIKICHTYPAMLKRGTGIPYPKKIQKIYESRETPLEFC